MFLFKSCNRKLEFIKGLGDIAAKAWLIVEGNVRRPVRPIWLKPPYIAITTVFLGNTVSFSAPFLDNNLSTLIILLFVKSPVLIQLIWGG